ncbi:MAG: helix-turn-helix domain-containing protein [Bacteroidota bacterium]
MAEINRKMQGHPIHIDKPLTVKEAASYLCLSKSRLYHLTSERAVPFFKRGQAILFRKEDLESKRQNSADEIRQEAKKYKER